MATGGDSRIPVLTDKNWAHWNKVVYAVLLERDAWGVTGGTETLSEAAGNAERQVHVGKQRKVLCLIIPAISEKLTHFIPPREEDPRVIWNNLNFVPKYILFTSFSSCADQPASNRLWTLTPCSNRLWRPLRAKIRCDFRKEIRLFLEICARSEQNLTISQMSSPVEHFSKSTLCHGEILRFISVLDYCRHLAREAEEILDKTYVLEFGQETVSYSFGFVGLVGDQSFQKTALGQFSNGFTFPSSYANVKLSELTETGGKVGIDQRWQEWIFDKLALWGKEQENRVSLAKKNGKNFNSNKALSDFLGTDAKANGHRQKCVPPIGKVIGANPFVCTLHVGINACANLLHDFYFHFLVSLLAAMHSFGFFPKGRANAANPSFMWLSNVVRKPTVPVHPIVLFVETLQSMGLNRIASAYADLWDGKAGRGEARLTGQDTRLFVHKFPNLTTKFLNLALNVQRLRKSEKSVASAMARMVQQLAFYHYTGLLLRKILTIANSSHSNQANLDALEQLCSRFHTIKAWVAAASGAKLCHNNDFTVGHILPLHARKLAEEYPSVGLGRVSSQGREHMHMRAKEYKKKTNWQNRWELVFEYAHISSLFLPGKFDSYGSFYQKTKGMWASYTPDTAKEIAILDMRCMEENCLFCSTAKSLPNKLFNDLKSAKSPNELRWLK